MKRVLLSWSSGKDSAWALHLLRHDAEIEVCALLTTLNSAFDRVAMHGTRHSVLQAQAAAAELPLWTVPLPWPCSNEVYEERMAEACQRAIDERIDAVAFGDLFLEDARAYRVRQLKPTGLAPLFPLWKMPDRRSGAGDDGRWSAAHASPASTASNCLAPLQGANSMRTYCAICRLGPTRAANEASFTPACTRGPCSHALALENGETVDRDGFVFTDFCVT